MRLRLANGGELTSNQATTFIQPAYFLFSLICTVESPEYKGNSSSSGSSVLTEWLVNLMYATVVNYFACSWSYLGLTRVIMKRYSWQIFACVEETEHLNSFYNSTPVLRLCQPLLGNSTWVRKDIWGSPLGLTSAETIPHFCYSYWEVFLSFQYSCPFLVF